MAGTLYVVATPIGNLEDLSPRARRILGEVAFIACEDTRRTGRLLEHAGIETPTISCHKFNEAARIEPLLGALREGRDVALVSDGGTPAISDPGGRLVDAVAREGLAISPIPGPNAAIALLSVSGLLEDTFHFEGFLPHRAGERRRRLRELVGRPHPVVVQESPHRLRATLDDLAALVGDRPLILGRELTKIHESILRGSAAAIATALAETIRGEIVLVVPPGALAEDDAAATLRTTWREQLAAHDGDERRALKATAAATGIKRAELARRLAEIGEGPSR